MSPRDTRATLATVKELWPKIDWHPDVRHEFARRVASLPIDYAQAQAVLLNVRLTKPFKSCEPSDLLGPLMAAAKPAERVGGRTPSIDAEMHNVKAFQQADPVGFRALCEELHLAEPRTPTHYRAAPSGYWEWPVSRAWLAARIRQIAPAVAA